MVWHIFIHEDRVIFTDFGIALDAKEQSTTTTGMSEAFTRRYCPPEVANNQPRNRKSDVFSLGCVFVEILAVVYPELGLSLLDPRPYWTRVDDVTKTLQSFQYSTTSSALLVPLISSVCEKMIASENELRYTAEEACAHIGKTVLRSVLFCDSCRTQFQKTSLN
jgi:serine/threonine protein kinase